MRDSYGAIAQLVERLNGIQKAAGSIPASSTIDSFAAREGVGHFLGGLVAAEGCFSRSVVGLRRDGSERGRYVFVMEMASVDTGLVELLHLALGVGSIHSVKARNPRWQSSVRFTVSSRRAHRDATVPFMQHFLPEGAKRQAFERWYRTLWDEELEHPSRWGCGPSPCSMDECSDPVRGQGLCRRHYYELTGW